MKKFIDTSLNPFIDARTDEFFAPPFFIRQTEFMSVSRNAYMSVSGIVLSNTGGEWFCYVEYASANAATAELALLIALAKNHTAISQMLT